MSSQPHSPWEQAYQLLTTRTNHCLMTWTEYGNQFRALIHDVTTDADTVILHVQCVRHYTGGQWRLYKPTGIEVTTTAWRLNTQHIQRLTIGDDTCIHFDLLKHIHSFTITPVRRDPTLA